MRIPDAKLAELEAQYDKIEHLQNFGFLIGSVTRAVPDLIADLREANAAIEFSQGVSQAYADQTNAAVERAEKAEADLRDAKAEIADARKAAGANWAPRATLADIVFALRKRGGEAETNYLAKHREEAPLRTAARLSDSYKAERDRYREALERIDATSEMLRDNERYIDAWVKSAEIAHAALARKP